MNGRGPIEETATIFRCPFCHGIFDDRDSCRFHIAVCHGEPPQKDMTLIGMYLYAEDYDRGYIMRITDVRDDGSMCGPSIEFEWRMHSYNTRIARATFRDTPRPTVIDEPSARRIYEGWCDRYMERIRNMIETMWTYTQYATGGDERWHVNPRITC